MEWAVGQEVPHLAEESTDTLLGDGRPFLFSNVAPERLPLLQQTVPYSCMYWPHYMDFRCEEEKKEENT